MNIIGKTKERLLKLWESMPCKIEWGMIVCVLGFCFFSFAHTDIIVTGNRSFLYYNHFFDFYKASYDMTGGFGANYLPSTFIVFAIWNLPLYLLGRIPNTILELSLINTMWYKLLPVLIYILSSILMEKIALEIGVGIKKAKLVKFAFLLCPIGIFSQFIVGQYDIFTVFFMLLGILFYLRNDWKKFIFFFGCAITFKYHVLVYFIVLVLLKQKKVWNVLLSVFFGCIPALVETLLYIRDPYFIKSVFGFSALEKASAGLDIGFFSTTNLILIMCLILFMWAYTINTRKYEDLIRWMIFLCSGVSFSLFGLCEWHPQWLVILAPFLILSIFINEYGKIFILLENIFIIAIYVLSVNAWIGGMDQSMLKYGVFKYILKEQNFAIAMHRLYGYNDITMLASWITGILIIYFVFSHPKYQLDDFKVEKSDIIGNVRILFLVGVLTFAVPAVICLKKTVDNEHIFYNELDYLAENVIALNQGNCIRQSFVADYETLYKADVYVGTYGRVNNSSIIVRVREVTTNKILYEDTKDTSMMVNDNSVYTIIDSDVELEKGNLYYLELESDAGFENCIGIYVMELEEMDDKQEILFVNEEITNYQMSLNIYGK